MMDAYGRAVVEERVRPRHLAELEAYLRREYGPGTGTAFVFAEMANGTAPSKPPRDRIGVLHTLVNAAKRIVQGNGNGRRTPTLHPTR